MRTPSHTFGDGLKYELCHPNHQLLPRPLVPVYSAFHADGTKKANCIQKRLLPLREVMR